MKRRCPRPKAERRILGAMLLDRSFARLMLLRGGAQMFRDPANATICQVLRGLLAERWTNHGAGSPTDRLAC